jgi:16S rRNA processing protein RimM
MAYNATILLGKIAKVYGFDGTVTVKLEKDLKAGITELKSVFLETEGKQVPFIISESDYQGGDILRLKFDGYDTVEKVTGFTGCRVFLTSDTTSKKPDKDPGDLRGYMVWLADNRLLGIVTEVIENPGQWLFNVNTTKGEEILIPLHEDLIIGIDKRKKIIRMDLPEGLTEINL